MGEGVEEFLKYSSYFILHPPPHPYFDPSRSRVKRAYGFHYANNAYFSKKIDTHTINDKGAFGCV